MGNLEREKNSYSCPNPKCERDIEFTYSEIFWRRELKCRRCGSGYKLGSSELNHLKTSLRDLERAQDSCAKAEIKLEQSWNKIISNADIIPPKNSK